MTDEYYIAVWDITFYKTDGEGNIVTDAEGAIQLYHAIDYDCTYLAEGLTEDDLIAVDSEATDGA